MPDILLPFVICGGFITNVGVCIILKHLAEQTTLHKQIHIIKGTGFFSNWHFFLDCKTDCFCCRHFFFSPHQPPLMKWICYHFFCGALPCQVSRLAFKVGTASSNLDFTAGVVRLWSAWRGKPNQLLVSKINHFFLVNQSFSWSYNYLLFEWTIKCCVCGQVCAWLNN